MVLDFVFRFLVGHGTESVGVRRTRVILMEGGRKDDGEGRPEQRRYTHAQELFMLPDVPRPNVWRCSEQMPRASGWNTLNEKGRSPRGDLSN